MFCPRCGLKLDDFAAFCPRCGTQVRASDYPSPDLRDQTPSFAPQGAYAPPQGAYAPQQGAYAPPQGAYVPQQGAYAQPQGAYVPQQGAYAHPQGAYVPQQGAYIPPQGAYPPAYAAYPYPAYPYPAYPYAAYPAARPAAPPKPPDPNAKMKRAFNLTTLSTLVIFAAQSVVVETGLSVIGVIAAVLLGITGDFFGSFDLQSILREVTSDTPAMFVFFTVYAVLYAIGMIGGIKISDLIRRRVAAAPPVKRKLPAVRFLSIVLICFGVWGVGVIIGNVGNFAAPSDSASFGWGSIPEWLIAIVGAPLFEETIFRKFLIDRLHPYGERLAVIFSALVFAMAHQNGMQFFLAFFLGIVFGIVYLRTGKLGYTIFLHFMINFVATTDEIGCLIFGDGFDIGWLIVCGALMVAGLIMLIVSLAGKDEFFRLEPNRIVGANRAAFKPWGVVLARVLVIVTIVGYGAFYTYNSFRSGNGALSLLHMLPAIAAVITILVVSKTTASKAAPPAAATELVPAYAGDAQWYGAAQYGEQYAPDQRFGEQYAPDAQYSEQYAANEQYGYDYGHYGAGYPNDPYNG